MIMGWVLVQKLLCCQKHYNQYILQTLFPVRERFGFEKQPWNCVDARERNMSWGWVMVRVLTCLYECRYDERLRSKVEESTHLVYNGLLDDLEHLKIKTRIIDEMFTSVMGEYVFLFIMNQESEIQRQDLYMSVGVMKD